MKFIFLDADGILVDAVKGFCKVHNKTNPYNDPDNLGKHNLDEIWRMSKQDFWKPCDQNFWETLEPMSDSGLIYEAVSGFAYNNGYTMAVLTKSGLGQGCLQGKKNWFDRHFPKLSKNFWVGFGSKAVCASPNNILIDDYDKNIAEFNTCGGTGILVPRPWNADKEHNFEKFIERLTVYK